VLSNEELQHDHVATLEKSARFLEIDPFPVLSELRLNETKAAEESLQPLTEQDRAWLRELLSPEVEELRTLTGQPFSEWEQDFPLQSASR
jgi:hypothetical protein